MNTILLFCLLGVIALFLFNVWNILFIKKDVGDKLASFRLSVFVFAITTILFFIYFSSTINLVGVEQVITGSDGTSYTVVSNDYKEAFLYLPLASALYAFQFFFLIFGLVKGFAFFGSPRMGRMS